MKNESFFTSATASDCDPRECRQCVPLIPETGDKLDEPLEVFSNGSININFLNDTVGFTRGETICGTVDIVLKEKMNFKNLVIKFAG